MIIGYRAITNDQKATQDCWLIDIQRSTRNCKTRKCVPRRSSTSISSRIRTVMYPSPPWPVLWGALPGVSSVAVAGASTTFTIPVVVLRGCLLGARLDGTVCCTLVLFTGSAAATVGLAPSLRFTACRDSEDVCNAAPPRPRLRSPPSPFPGRWGHRILDGVHSILRQRGKQTHCSSTQRPSRGCLPSTAALAG